MDRNYRRFGAVQHSQVALRKESVDRNNTVQVVIVVVNASLSARRAWIEIMRQMPLTRFYPGSLSARRAWIEITHRQTVSGTIQMSLSARRAWIEILAPRLADMSAAVALRKESVDRNNIR